MSSPTAGLTYNLITGGTSIANNTTGVFANLLPGTYTVSSSNLCGTSVLSNAVLLMAASIPSPIATASQQPTCVTSTGHITITSPAQTPGTFFSIDGINFTNTSGIFANLLPNTYSCFAKIGACLSPATSVTINPPPPLVTPSVSIAAQSTTICAGSNVIVNASLVNGGPAPVYQWKVNGIVVPGQTMQTFTTSILNNNDQVSMLMISNAACLTTSSATSNILTITVNALPVVSVSNPAEVCAPDKVDLTRSDITVGSSNALTYSYWRNANATIPLTNPNLIATSGLYFIKGTNSTNCSVTKQVEVKIIPQIPPVRYPTVSTISFINADLLPGPRSLSVNDKYGWSPSIGLNNYSIRNPRFYYGSSVDYFVKITAANGCTVVDTLLVKIVPVNGPPGSDIYFFVPNAWTPNGDGINDRLKPTYARIKELSYFKVYNRWSQVVYETKKMGEGWDGKFKGILQPLEAYIWIAEGKNENGKIVKAKGTSLLLR